MITKKQAKTIRKYQQLLRQKNKEIKNLIDKKEEVDNTKQSKLYGALMERAKLQFNLYNYVQFNFIPEKYVDFKQGLSPIIKNLDEILKFS